MRGRVAGGALAGVVLSCRGAACSAVEPEAHKPEAQAQAQRTHTPVTIAFAGDVHFAGVLSDRLTSPTTAMGPLTGVLAAADLGILNLETAVTTRGAPQPKEFTFRSPPVVFDALRDAGVDVVTMANNHALDYGMSSVPDALAAASAAGLPVVGLGADDQQAFAPWMTTVKGERIAVLGATAVVDDRLVRTWSAGPGQPGVATAIDGRNDRLVAAVRAARGQADTVVVELHYGKDLTTCPTAVQRRLARTSSPPAPTSSSASTHTSCWGAATSGPPTSTTAWATSSSMRPTEAPRPRPGCSSSPPPAVGERRDVAPRPDRRRPAHRP